MLVDFSQATFLQKHKILSHSITPRPIAWVSTLSKKGINNLAPFSFFAPICSEPALVSLYLTPKSDGSMKDTLKNILDTKKATICLCDERHLNALQSSSIELEYDVSESEKFHIEMQSILEGYPPIVKDVGVAFFCDFYSFLEVNQESKPFFLEIKHSYIDKTLYEEDLNFTFRGVGRVGKSYQISGILKNIKNL
ncbi:flavin reductase family protein [Helicobacter cetorum]|uniref:flavin reductase family protein n=1 Tax=Helicobacter cetorum TaxID=138563 RepID=UPI000CF18B91|nr:flavin reductase [Helicobacter cetorum]